MRRGYVDDVDVLVLYELRVGSVGDCGGGAIAFLQELLGSLSGG